MNLERYLETVNKLAIDAGKEIMEVYNTDFSDTIEYKKDDSPLTLADKKSNDLIVDSLKAKYPQISILSEESALDETRFSNDYVWVIDPLDGTKEFVKKNGEFTVNIALVYKKRPILGVIYIPVTKELFFAAKNIGAFKRVGETTTKIHVTEKTDNLIMAGSRSHATEALRKLIEDKKDLIKEIITSGSSIKGTLIAEGKVDVYYRYNLTNEWDTAAMHCIVEEAGGRFRQMDGSEMLYNRKNTTNEKGFFIVNRKENIWI